MSEVFRLIRAGGGWEMSKRSKTAGERIAKWHANKHSAWGVPMIGDVSLARRIDRAIRAAVKESDERINDAWCAGFVAGGNEADEAAKDRSRKPAKKTKGEK
jgi:hypothetical protein